MIDLAQKGMSKGELDSVLKAVGGLDNLLDQKSKSYASLAYLAYDGGQEGKAARGRHADENANCPQRPSGNCRLPARCLGAVGITSPKPFYASERLFPSVVRFGASYKIFLGKCCHFAKYTLFLYLLSDKLCSIIRSGID